MKHHRVLHFPWLTSLAAIAWVLLVAEGLASEPWLFGAVSERRIIHLDGSDLQTDVAGAGLQLRFSAEDLPLAESGVEGLRAYWGRDGSPLVVHVDYYDPGNGVVMTVRAPLVTADVNSFN